MYEQVPVNDMFIYVPPIENRGVHFQERGRLSNGPCLVKLSTLLFQVIYIRISVTKNTTDNTHYISDEKISWNSSLLWFIQTSNPLWSKQGIHKQIVLSFSFAPVLKIFWMSKSCYYCNWWGVTIEILCTWSKTRKARKCLDF